MKKLSILGLCALGLVFFSCSDDKNDYIPPALDDPTEQEPTTPDDEDEVVYNQPEFTPHVDGEPYDSYKGLVMAGYQGWFGAPDDGCSHGNQFYHWQGSGGFNPGVLRNTIDFWPDMSEYEKQYDTSFTYPDGTTATVYSAYDESTVLLHFKWMKEYGLDGVFMQRFVSEVINNPAGKDHFDKVLESAMKGSNQYERAVCVMYDLGGFMSDGKRTVNAVLDDAQSIMDKYNLLDRTQQKFYLYENGKPLIVLWGVGFNDGRPYSLDDIQQLMDGLKQKGFSIMLGVPTHWRSLSSDCLNDKKVHELIKAADVVMPWFVGRYDRNSYPNFHSLIAQDIEWCKDPEQGDGVEYAPLCFPGFSWRNMNPSGAIISRERGGFIWDQMYNCIKSGAQMLYIAMFDEVDEGTAIYKCLNASDVPSNDPGFDYWVVYQDGNYRMSNYEIDAEDLDNGEWCRKASELNVVFQGIEDGLPTDHYLWLVGQAREMLRGNIPLSKDLPVRQ